MEPQVDVEELKRQLLWVPCESKEQLWYWVKTFLNVELPTETVDDESNTNPTELLWEIYSKAWVGSPDFTRILAAAARGGGKTFLASIIELLMVLHHERNVGHGAALKVQSQFAARNIQQFLGSPYLSPFVSRLNETKIEFTKFVGPKGTICQEEFDRLPEGEKGDYEKRVNFIQIIILTRAGANGLHVPFLVLDELELADPIAVEETKYIPESTRDGKPCVTILTSSRKFAFGGIQQELDKAHKTGLQYRHWNIIDVSKPCPPERHLPEEPKIEIFVDPKELSAISRAEFDQLPKERQEPYHKTEGYAGCLAKCKIFAACKGALATKQPRDMKFLKPITVVQDMFTSASPEQALAQLLCHKPSSEGMIYSKLDKDVHMIPAYKVAEKLTGDEFPSTFGFNDLLELCKSRDVSWYAGVDFGTVHDFAIVLLMVDGHRAFLMGSWRKSGLDPTEKLAMAERTLGDFDPVIFPDMASTETIKFFKKHGLRVREWKKGPGSVLDGIDTVRYKLKPSVFTNEPQLYFVSDAPGMDHLFRDASQYHWELDSNGDLTEVPAEVIGRDENDEIIWDDAMDAMRYVVQNVFHNRGKLVIDQSRSNQKATPLPQKEVQKKLKDEVVRQAFASIMGAAGGVQVNHTSQTSQQSGESTPNRKRRGGVFWSIE